MHRLLLMVTHAFMLERGTLPHCYFDKAGGIIGANKAALWKINNLKNEFSDIEFEIKYYDSSYCLISYTSNIFINGSSYALPVGGIIKLKDNDVISLFNYEIRAKIFTNRAEVVTLQDELSFLVNNPADKTSSEVDYSKLPDLSCSLSTLPKGGNLLIDSRDKREEVDPMLVLKDMDVTEDVLALTPSYMPNSNYKFFNPYIDSNLEYHDLKEPNIFHNIDEPVKNNLYNTPQDVFTSSGSMSTVRECDDREKIDEEILDPLFFIK